MPLTRDQARKELERRGISIAEFSRAHDLNPNLVSDLLAGRKKGLRGEAHRAAVLLGIKEGVIDDHGDFPSSAPTEYPLFIPDLLHKEICHVPGPQTRS